MNYKPDEQTLIAWMYGELSDPDKERVNLYLKEHPEVLDELQAMERAREIVGTLGDKEVIVPPVFMDDRPNVRPLWSSTYFKAIASIAASFLLLMVAARLMGIQVHYGSGELRIAFGAVPVPREENHASVTPEAVQGMIRAALVKNNETIESSWAENQKKTDDAIRQRLDLNSRKMNDMLKATALASQDQVRDFVGRLQNENLRLMKDYLQLSSTEQKKYVETLLVDFSKYLQEQRNQDISTFQMRMSSMEQNTNQFKQETETILSSIIANAGVAGKQNNY